MPNCTVCNLKIDRNVLDKIVDCNKCKKSYHINCVKLTVEYLNLLKRDRKCWNCDTCYKDIINDNISQLTNQVKELTSYVRSGFEKVDSVLEKIVKVEKENLFLSSENIKMKKRIELLEFSLNKIEQEATLTSLEISGIPDSPDDNVNNLVVNMCTDGLGMTDVQNQIKHCYRIKTEKMSKIIVECKTAKTRNDILKLRREKKNNFPANSFGVASNNTVYVNECLTSLQRHLLFSANQLKREGKYQYVWVRDGNIMMRKKKGDKIIYIKKVTDLDKCCPPVY